MSVFKKIRIFTYYLIGCLLLGLLGIAWYQGWQDSTKILFPAPQEDSSPLPTQAEDYGLEISPFTFKREDGEGNEKEETAYLLKNNLSDSSALALKSKSMSQLLKERALLPEIPLNQTHRGTVLLVHDWQEDHTSLLPLAEYLTSAQFHCLLYDTRGHGKNTGEMCTHGKEEVLDMKKLLDAAQNKEGSLGPVTVLGKGLGAGYALEMGSQDPRVRCVVALNAYPSLKDEYWDQLSEAYSPWLVYVRYLLTDQFLYSRLGMRCFSIAPVASGARLKIPTLLLAYNGKEEKTAYNAQKIYEALGTPEGEKQVWTDFPTTYSPNFPENELSLYAQMIEWLATKSLPQKPSLFVPTKSVPPQAL